MKGYCFNCREEIDRSPCYIKRNKTGLYFCNSSCRSQYYRKNYKVRCVVCDSEFEKAPAEQKRYPVHCCSTKCRAKNNNKREIRRCDECGKIVHRPPSVWKGNKNIFCSIKCYDIFQNQKTEIKCAKCGKKVWKSPSAMKERHYFCSRGCFSKYAFSESFVETEFENLVKNLGIPYIRNDRSVLYGCAKHGGGLELDFYFPYLKFAVEVNGGCHYRPIYGEEALAGQKIRDKKKRQRCKELGIILRVVKPGNCKRETYLPRYKRVIWEIKNMERHELFCKRRDDMKPLFDEMKIDLTVDKYGARKFLISRHLGPDSVDRYITLSTNCSPRTNKEIPNCSAWCQALSADGFIDEMDGSEWHSKKYQITEEFVTFLIE